MVVIGSRLDCPSNLVFRNLVELSMKSCSVEGTFPSIESTPRLRAYGERGDFFKGQRTLPLDLVQQLDLLSLTVEDFDLLDELNACSPNIFVLDYTLDRDNESGEDDEDDDAPLWPLPPPSRAVHAIRLLPDASDEPDGACDASQLTEADLVHAHYSLRLFLEYLRLLPSPSPLRIVYLADTLYPFATGSLDVGRAVEETVLLCEEKGIEVEWEKEGDWGWDSLISRKFWRRRRRERAAEGGSGVR